MSTSESGLTVIPEIIDALSVSREPSLVLQEARKAAIALKEVIDGKKKKVTFNGETYLEAEDWLTVARFYGVTARIKSTNYIEYGDVKGFEATAEAFLVSTGQIVSMAESMCLNDEPNWSRKPLFQLRSMAQTRSMSRVLRQVFGWVVVLAGYRPTPAEEIQDISDSTEGHDIKRPQRKEAKPEEKAPAPRDAECISEGQSKRLYAICKQLKLSDDEIKAEMRRLCKDKAGNPLEHSWDMLKKDYEGFIDAVDPQFLHHDKPKSTAGGEKSGKYDRENF